MPKAKLDHAFCLKAACQPGKLKTDWWNEGDPIGLLLETRQSGKSTFYFRYQDTRSRQRQIKLGGFPEISVEQARKAARRLRSEVVLGGDPLAAKRIKRSVLTYAELAEQHIARAKTYQRSWWSTEGLLRKHVVPRFGRMRLDEITSQDVAKWLADKAAEGLSPASCTKLRVLLGRSYQLALEWRLAGAEINPARGVRLPAFDNRRTRFLDAAQYERLLTAAAASPNPQMLPIVVLLSVTGMRLRELLDSRWDSIDLARQTLHLPMCKNGKGRHVPLAQAAVEVLEALPRIEGCPYIFGNPRTGKPLVSIKHSWQTIRREARLGDLRLHDLRHHCASALVNAGVDLYSVGLVLGHADLKSTSRYAHVSNGTLLAAVEAGAAKLANLSR